MVLSDAFLVGSAAHERDGFVLAKERLHLVVFFQLWVHDDAVDATLDAVFVEVFEHQHGDATLLIFRHDAHD